MSFRDYLKFKKKTIAAFFSVAVIITATLCLEDVSIELLFYPLLLGVVAGLAFLFTSYMKAKAKYEELEKISRMSLELIDSFPEEAELYEEEYQTVIKNICNQARETKAASLSAYSDMMDYYSMWAHQIKTPIASMRLNLQNEDSKLSRTLLQDLNRIERYADMVMAYLRIDSKDNDLLIKEHELDDIIRPVIRRFSNDFISKGLRLEYENLNYRVLTDDKWLAFVLEQLLSNAVKYTNKGSVEIFVKEGCLFIKDSGIGIASEDIPRVFEKGYTGFNGHMDKRASGIGLYLCKRACKKLGHEIRIESVVGKGTTAIVDLNINKLGIE